MSVTDTIETRIKSFKASSFFTAGDPYSFSVKLSDEFALPGKYNPRDYLARLGLELEGKNVLVVCPGNSGLCIEAIHAGASTVVGFEPRTIYLRPMNTIAEFVDELVGTSFIRRKADAELVEKFDVVIWAEGVDDIPHPRQIFNKVFDAIAPGGQFCLEIGLGTHGELPLTTNCWKPTSQAVVSTVESYGDFSVIGKSAGRNQTRKIFTIANNEKMKVESLSGSGFTTVESVEDFAAKLKEELSPSDTDIDITVSTPKRGAPDTGLDSVYDAAADDQKTASTPKSQAKKDKAAAEAAIKPKNGKPKA
jgi:threonine dehydrogenase-like Zn-dependent dehydrogenase